jgi:hypothetical protein
MKGWFFCNFRIGIASWEVCIASNENAGAGNYFGGSNENAGEEIILVEHQIKMVELEIILVELQIKMVEFEIILVLPQ